MWIFGFSHGVCPMELRNLVFSLGCLVSNGIQALLGGFRLGGSATLLRARLPTSVRPLAPKLDSGWAERGGWHASVGGAWKEMTWVPCCVVEEEAAWVPMTR